MSAFLPGPHVACRRGLATVEACGLLCALIVAWISNQTAAAQSAEADDLRSRIATLAKSADAERYTRDGTVASLRYNLEVSERIGHGFEEQARAIRQRVSGWLTQAEAGHEPLLDAKGEILMRGYRSTVSETLQGYAVYIPPNYDPKRRYPLMIMLHGGSANGNLFLGVALGNNMNWKEYHKHLWDQYQARWSPDWIVVAPDGFGQVMWRFMGEQDVLDVLENVQRHYSVDPDRIVLCGLSNGGVGAYNLGMRHAHRFAAVIPIAGAPSWMQYAHAAGSPLDQRLLAPLSGMQLIENAYNTRLHYHHGRLDGGPMKPGYVDELDSRVKELNVPAKGTWYQAGHDLLYLVHRHGRIYDQLADLRRDRHPQQVHLVTGDYRAAQQHWLEATRIENYPSLARLTATCKPGELRVDTENVLAFRIHVKDLPSTTDPFAIYVNGQQVYAGPRAALGDYFHLTRREWGFAPGFPQDAQMQKRPLLSGPITDAYFDSIVHVYGTANPARTEALQKTAERGAKGWPLWLWHLDQRVMADSEVTEDILSRNHVVLYGSPGDNRLLDRIAKRMPIQVEGDEISVGGRRYRGTGLGVKFIYPNPLSPQRYVIVQTGPTLAGVTGGHLLPDFLPDYVVFDQATTRRRPRLLYSGGQRPLAQGFFDDRWQLPAEGNRTSTGDNPVDSEKDQGDLPSPALQGRDAPSESRMHQPKEGLADAVAAGPAGTPSLHALTDPFAAHPSRGRSQAAIAATLIAHRARGFPNSRARIRLGTWTTDPGAIWSIRDNDQCMRHLSQQQIAVEIYRGDLPTPVPAPVELIGPVDDIWFRSAHPDRAVLMSCELAARLPTLVAILKRHGVRGVDVMSSYRPKPHQSFHTLGLGLDLMRFWTPDGSLSVLDDFEPTPNHPTCSAPAARTEKGRTLRSIACDLAASHAFSSVLTPNYNAGHRDHFHVDARPGDARVFIR